MLWLQNLHPSTGLSFAFSETVTLGSISEHRYSLYARRELLELHDGTLGARMLRMPVPYDIQERAFAFSCQIIEFCRQLRRSDDVTRRMSWQLLDAATGIGANLEEADAGQTKRDFIAKTSIARKETAESRYWLRLIAFAEPEMSPKTTPLVDESHQILKILTTIIKRAESNPNRGH